MTISTNYGDLLKRQAWLQQAGAAHLGNCNLEQIRVALLAEIGELAQELKPEWAWWTKAGDRQEVDRDKVLGEAVDVLHFALLLDLKLGVDRSDSVIKPWWPDRRCSPNYHLTTLPTWVCPDPDDAQQAWGICIAQDLCNIVQEYGFTPHDLAAAYWAKTEVNLKRWGAA